MNSLIIKMKVGKFLEVLKEGENPDLSGWITERFPDGHEETFCSDELTKGAVLHLAELFLRHMEEIICCAFFEETWFARQCAARMGLRLFVSKLKDTDLHIEKEVSFLAYIVDLPG